MALVALLALLAYGAVNLGGDGGNQAGQAGKDDRGDGAASSITPGPTSSAPVDSERPGGRDDVEDDEGNEDDEDNASGSGGASGGGSDDDSGDSDGSSGDEKGSSGASGGGGDDVKGLAACRAGQAKVSLESVKDQYAPGERPKLRIKVENTSGTACRADVSAERAVLTIVDDDEKTVWASDHCAPEGTTQLRVAARGEATHTVSWERKRSAASCATPSGGAPGAGSYEARVVIPDVGSATSLFVLAKD